MIVDPDFADHWKTRLLVDLLGDEAAPVYLLRLWAHCQNRRTSRFANITPVALKALCRFPGAAELIESSLFSAGFIRRGADQSLIVHQWDEYNSSLIANWENGKKGGRPKGTNNPTKTHGLPMDIPSDNPRQTHAEPIEKRREEKTEDTLSPAREDDPPGGRPGEQPTLAQFQAECVRYSIPGWYAEEKWNNFAARGWRSGATPVVWREAVKHWVTRDYQNDGRPLTKPSPSAGSSQGKRPPTKPHELTTPKNNGF